MFNNYEIPDISFSVFVLIACESESVDDLRPTIRRFTSLHRTGGQIILVSAKHHSLLLVNFIILKQSRPNQIGYVAE